MDKSLEASLLALALLAPGCQQGPRLREMRLELPGYAALDARRADLSRQRAELDARSHLADGLHGRTFEVGEDGARTLSATSATLVGAQVLGAGREGEGATALIRVQATATLHLPEDDPRWGLRDSAGAFRGVGSSDVGSFDEAYRAAFARSLSDAVRQAREAAGAAAADRGRAWLEGIDEVGRDGDGVRVAARWRVRLGD
ncbi:MAG: hypothetical protein HY722_16785 [Planctomycetes bacterium]|nr:hypothetical protein [Planctomycetota bacterium]